VSVEGSDCVEFLVRNLSLGAPSGGLYKESEPINNVTVCVVKEDIVLIHAEQGNV